MFFVTEECSLIVVHVYPSKINHILFHKKLLNKKLNSELINNKIKILIN